MTDTNTPRRRAGLLVPLFSMHSSRSWGIGEIADLPRVAAWMRRAGQSLLQLLPINEVPVGEQSPYSALSAMAIDPQFISLRDLPDLGPAGAEEGLDAGAARDLAAARASRGVAYRLVRGLKRRALRNAFDRFVEREWRTSSPRARTLGEYIAREAWWLDDYALFRALHRRAGERPWMTWDAPLRHRAPAALATARRELAGDVLYHQYVQWVAGEQWQEARRAARPMEIYGDFPFMVAADSADVWSHQDEFDLASSVGTPPDEFSEDGQNWRLPVYRWDVLEARGDDWLADRARRAAALYDGVRIDHIVGFYRTHVVPGDGGPRYFTPAGEADQVRQGERVMRLFMESGAAITVEDLGTVPTFVRASLARLGAPGYRVFRWERDWKSDGKPFADPVNYPAISVATSGTHDMEPLAAWWESLPADDRRAVGAIPSLRRIAPGIDFEEAAYDARLRDGLLETLYAAGSEYLILPVQDVFGWSNRINEPATVTDENWTYRLPWGVDEFDRQPEARDRVEFLARLGRRHGRVRE